MEEEEEQYNDYDDEEQDQQLHGYGGQIGQPSSSSSTVAVPNSKDDEVDDAVEEEEEEELRRKRVEEEVGVVGERQAKFVQDNQDPANASADAIQAAKEEVDSRSIYVGNVDYECIPEEVQAHFQSCGTVNRVTILSDRYGQPKGFAYVEFLETEAVQNALLLNESELHGRQLKVSAKRTNIPGMKQYQGRQPNHGGFRPRRPFIPGATPYSPYVYGRVPRFRRPMRYRPY